ncbi:hypothetical protein LRP30_29565 [Bradyrhizobium sp. C-145]|uniref:hypothetical protein n=1 Tax=Bradyrhizobium sp. C-145 TaxID=574727 RepID=UPI00201B9380|nr:hypothetical protein [Bradyrhizobium sp. C-145]UQR61098.1 hypothetical protein LRP30_29565 [Bradyrhizobium sp. C-145]
MRLTAAAKERTTNTSGISAKLESVVANGGRGPRVARALSDGINARKIPAKIAACARPRFQEILAKAEFLSFWPCFIGIKIFAGEAKGLAYQPETY